MTTFAPPLADCLVDIFERIELDPAKVEPRHWISARRSMNLIQSDWSNLGISLFKVALQSVALVQGQISYPVPAATVDVLDTYLSVTNGGIPVDTLIWPLSRNDYAATPNKTQQGRPTSAWFNKAPASGPMSLLLWPAPDGSGPYVLNFYTFARLNDAEPAMGGALDVRHTMYRAWISAVAADMAIKFRPDKFQMLSTVAETSLKLATDNDSEKVPIHMAPELSAYYQ